MKIGDFFYLSSVEVIEKPRETTSAAGAAERTPGKGVAHIFKFDAKGRLVKDLVLGEEEMYHPGGLDYDGRWIWVPVAEYRPKSRTIVYRVDPGSMQPSEAFRFPDHVGSLTRNLDDGTLVGVNWGTQVLYTWDLTGKKLMQSASWGNHYIDYQDCHFAGGRAMLCGGSSYFPGTPIGDIAFGGLELIDLKRMTPVEQIPVLQFTPTTKMVLTRNPMWAEPYQEGLRFYFLPEPGGTSLYVYDAR